MVYTCVGSGNEKAPKTAEQVDAAKVNQHLHYNDDITTIHFFFFSNLHTTSCLQVS